jgi:hypothetical protein
VELMVHGVSGTPPNKLLEYPPELIELSYGDDNAGFYRVRPGLPTALSGGGGEATSPAERRPAAWVPEAFSWGHLTSGPATRALWLLFLPFVLVNLAHWMLPPTNEKEPTANTAETDDNAQKVDIWASWSVRLLRFFGLTLSITLLLALVSVAVDLVGWQCPDLPQCADRLGPLKCLSGWTPEARLAVTAAPVLGVVSVLLRIGKSNPRIGQPPPDAARRSASPLTHPNFWNVDRSVSRLRDCHVTVWFSAVTAVVMAASLTLENGAPHAPARVFFVLDLLFVVAGFVFTCCDRITARGGKGLKGDQSDRPPTWPKWMWVSSLVVSVASLGWVFASQWYADPKLEVPVRGPLPYLATATDALILGQFLLLLALTVATWLSKRSSDRLPADYRPTLNGLAGPCVATLAWLFGGEASVALGFFVARYLGQPVGSAQAASAVTHSSAEALQRAAAGVVGLANPASGSSITEASSKLLRDFVSAANGRAPLQLSAVYFNASAVNLVMIVWVVIIALATAVVTVLGGRTAFLRCTWGDYGGETAADEAAESVRSTADSDAEKVRKKRAFMRIARVRTISSVRAWAALTDHAPVLLVSAIVVAVVASAAMVVLRLTLAHVGTRGLPAWLSAGAAASSRMDAVLLTGQALTGAVTTVVVGFAYQAFRNTESRRRLAVLWDVVTFWPRASHPLGPPCYGERAVPDLWLRTTLLAQQSKIVIAAHSQGTVIAAAAFLINSVQASDSATVKAQPPLLSRPVALLTFGSPLRRLYARNFPAYFGYGTLEQFSEQARAGTPQSSLWVNMWALTDPIGGWIFTEDLGKPPPDTPDGPVVDRRLADAEALEPVDGRYPPICGHSGFWTRPEYRQSLNDLANRIIVPAPAPTGDDTEFDIQFQPAVRTLSPMSNIPYRLTGPGE